MDNKKGWFSSEVLKALGWMAIFATPFILYFGDKYVELSVRVAAIDASQLKADDLKGLREDIRHAIKDALSQVESRIQSDEARISNLEARK